MHAFPSVQVIPFADTVQLFVEVAGTQLWQEFCGLLPPALTATPPMTQLTGVHVPLSFAYPGALHVQVSPSPV